MNRRRNLKIVIFTIKILKPTERENNRKRNKKERDQEGAGNQLLLALMGLGLKFWRKKSTLRCHVLLESPRNSRCLVLCWHGCPGGRGMLPFLLRDMNTTGSSQEFHSSVRGSGPLH